MEKNEYDSVRQMRGIMNIKRLPDPGALSRLHYMYVLRSWPERQAAGGNDNERFLRGGDKK